MKSTINDVAKQAGVSIKTVSRVINNEASVRQATRDKVMAAVNALNYQPNLAARSLAGVKAYTIAFVYDNPNAYYVIDMQNGILNECKKNGFELLIHPCNAKSNTITDEITNMIRHSRIAGLVLTPPFSEDTEFVEKIKETNVNIVRIVSGIAPPDQLSQCIMINDHETAFNITQHLIDLGHNDIAFISGGKEHRSSYERLNGYQAALEKNGITVNPELIIDAEYSFESGVEGVKSLMDASVKPSAIFCCNDEIAAGALFSARLMNIEVPAQLSIAGFENSPFSRQTWPKLTTAHQPTQEIAQLATSVLVSQIRNEAINEADNVFTPQLIERDSSAKYSAS